MIDDDFYDFYSVDPDTNELTFDTTHYVYITLRDAFAMSGIDIQEIKTEEKLNRIWYEQDENVMQIVNARVMNRDPTNLESALLQAIFRDDYDEADRIREKLRKIRSLGLNVVIPKNKP